MVLHAIPGNCRSQPAGDRLKCAAFIQFTRVIVNDHRQQAGSYKGSCARSNQWKPQKRFFTQSRETVGASLLALDSSAPRLSSSHALSLTTIASKLAPTGIGLITDDRSPTPAPQTPPTPHCGSCSCAAATRPRALALRPAWTICAMPGPEWRWVPAGWWRWRSAG